MIERCHSLLEEINPVLRLESVDPDLKERATVLLDDLGEVVRQFRAKNRMILIPDRGIYRDFVRFVLGGTGAKLVECVGSQGYGRLADIERFSGIEFRYPPRSVWRRLHALGILYGKEYSYLTSRGVTAYKILTGNHPVPSKKDARTFDPIPEEKCIEDLTLKIVTHPPISPGALILIKALGTDRIYDVSTLRSHALTKAYFKSDQEWDEAFNEIKKARLVVVSDDEGVVLTRLGRYVWSVFFGDDRPGDDSSAPSRRRTGWVEDLAAHYTKQGYRIRKDQYVGDTSIRFDMYLERPTVLWRNPPLDEEARVSGSCASSMQFMRHGMTFVLWGLQPPLLACQTGGLSVGR